MKLHSPIFEKALRRGVKHAVQSSSALKREYRNAKKAGRRRILVNWMVRPFWSVLLGYFVYVITRLTQHPVTGLAIINLWTLIALSFSVRNLQVLLGRAPDLAALNLLPIADTSIYRWEMQKFFRKSALPCVLDQAVGFGVLAGCLNFSIAQWVATMMLAVLSSTMLLALTLFCAAWLPRFKYELIPSGAFFFGLILIMAFHVIGPAVLYFFDSMAPLLNLILPTGWAPSLFQLFLPEGTWLVASLIIPVVLAIWTIKNSLGRLQGRMKFRERIIPEAFDQIPREKPAEDGSKDKTAQPPRLGVTAIEEIIRSRQFLLHEQPQGWLERRLWKWLNPRERAVIEFAFPKGLQITKPWKNILRNFLLMVLIGFVSSTMNRNVANWVFGVGVFITFLQAVGRILANGMAFRALSSSGVRVPMYAAYPITFSMLSKTLFKPAIIQLPLFIACATVCASLLAYLAGASIAYGIIIGFKAGILVFSGRFITTVLAFSSCTNDSTQFRLCNIALVVVMVGCALLFMLLGGAGLFVPDVPVAWLLWLAALFDAYAFFKIYGWFYHANCFDLMNFPRR